MKKLILLLARITISCSNNNSRQKKNKHVNVHSWKVTGNTTNSSTDDDWIYWYIIYSNYNTCPTCCYTYNSNSPVTNYENVQWSQSNQLPTEIQSPEAQELEVQSVEPEQFSEQMENNFDTTPENFEGMTADEMGDYEGAGDGNDGSSDNSSGDSGGDSGGGDSGGGDGGGD